jgi:hypothetical protein
MKYFFLFFLIISFNANSQNNNSRDSIILNSPPYMKWYSEFRKVKNDTNFQKLLLSNTELKKQYDTADKYFKLYNKKQFSLLLNLYGSYGLLFVFINNPGTPYLILPSYALLGYEFGQINKTFLLANKFFVSSKSVLENSGYDLHKENWKVSFLDRWRYNNFTKKSSGSFTARNKVNALAVYSSVSSNKFKVYFIIDIL